MEFVRELSGLSIAPVLAHLASSQIPFEASQLYDSQKDAKVSDPSLRRSKFRLFKDAGFFDMLQDGIMGEVNRTDTSKTYSLVRNDITHIVYGPGDFFKRHSDYLSVTSNIVEEYTLIICVTPPELEPPSGGQTLIHTWPDQTHHSTATSTPGSAILFRKDLEHEGALLTAGEKHIITLNLWAMQQTASDERIVHVTFPALSVEHDDDAERGKRKRSRTEDAQSHAAALRSVLDDQSYAISVAALARHEHCSLAAFVRFAEQQGSGDGRVLHYECSNATYEEFGTVYKILQQSYVSADDVHRHAKLIDYYALDKRSILVDLADPGPDDAEANEKAASALATQLRTELMHLTPRALQARALEMGIAKGKVDAMLDAHDVKGFLVELMIDAELTVLRAPIHSSRVMQEREKDEQLARFGLSHPGGSYAAIGYNQVRALGKAVWAVQLHKEAKHMCTIDLAPQSRASVLLRLLMHLLLLEGHTHDLIQSIFPEEMSSDFQTAKQSIFAMPGPHNVIPEDQLGTMCSKVADVVLNAAASLCEELLDPPAKFIDLDCGGIDVTVLPDHKRIESKSLFTDTELVRSGFIRIYTDTDGSDAADYGGDKRETYTYADPITGTEEQALAWAEYRRNVEARTAAGKAAAFGSGMGCDLLADNCFVSKDVEEDERVNYSRLRGTLASCKAALLECEVDMPTESPVHVSSTGEPEPGGTLSLLDASTLESRGDVVVCGTEQRTGVISACAKGLGAPYIPFRVAFVEGLVDWGAGDCQGKLPQQVPMSCVWVSLGDYDNVFACRSIEVEDVRRTDGGDLDYSQFALDSNTFRLTGDSEELLEHSNAAICMTTTAAPGYTPVHYNVAKAEESDADSDCDDWGDFSDTSVCYGLKVALGRRHVSKPECAHKSELVQQIMSMMKGRFSNCFDLAIVLPDVHGREDTAAAAATTPVTSPHFHIDAAGKACFTKDEAELASKRIMEIDLVGQVKKKIVTTDFVLPQLKQTASAHFCNEAIYGKMNLLMVTGIVRLG